MSRKHIVKRGMGLVLLIAATVMDTGCAALQGLMQGLQQRGGQMMGGLGAGRRVGANRRQVGRAPMQGQVAGPGAPRVPAGRNPGRQSGARDRVASGGGGGAAEKTYTGQEWADYLGRDVAADPTSRLTEREARGAASQAQDQEIQQLQEQVDTPANSDPVPGGPDLLEV